MFDIIFRVWDKKNKKMINPWDAPDIDAFKYKRLVYTDILGFAIGADGSLYVLDACGNYASVELKDYVLMLYTGYNDMYDHKIYDGDIVAFDFNGNYGLIGEVRFINGGFKIVHGDSMVPLCDAENVRVISNIYEGV